MSINHLTNEQLQSLVDGTLPTAETMLVSEHLRDCFQCRNANEALRQLDRVLKSLPAENLGADFTRNVLARLDIVPQSDFLFRVVENLAYVFGMMIVLGVMVAVFILTGVLGSSQVSETQTRLSTFSNAVAGQMSHVMSAFTTALQSYLPFLFGNGNLRIAVMGTCIVGMLALLDRFLKKRIFR